MTSESINYDVVIVGGGPSGLAFAVSAKETNPDLSVLLVEKGAFFGAHGVSGAIIEPYILDDWLPEWRDAVRPVPVKKDRVHFLTKRHRFPLPGTGFSNKKNCLISIGALDRFLAEAAERKGVDLITAASASDFLMKGDQVAGIQMADGTNIHAKTTVLAEGSYGYLAQKAIKRFNLAKDSQPQSYALGLKEVWEIKPTKKIKKGDVHHFMGWPLPLSVYGGGFFYALSDTKIALGLTVGLDYTNPSLDPFQTMQLFKTHPFVSRFLKDGKRISYGARSLTEGGFQSIPEISFPGGLIIGDAAGVVNVPKIKGIHNALLMGKTAGEILAKGDTFDRDDLLVSAVGRDLYAVRNVRPAFQDGFFFGLVFAGMNNYALQGRYQSTFKIKEPVMKPLKKGKTIPYPAPDGTLTFDKPSSTYLCGLSAAKGEHSHLKIKDPKQPAKDFSLYGSPEACYCPGEVYQLKSKTLIVHSENCLHCKTCSIKSRLHNITWTPPRSQGPTYHDL